MSLLQKIKKDQLSARKAKETANASILTTLIGEASMIGKNDGNRETTDAEVVAVIKKFIKNNTELMAAVHPEAEAYIVAQNENDFLTQYLPSQLTEDQLIIIIREIITSHDLYSPQNMGIVMKELKEKYDGEYDGKLASKLTKELLCV